MNKKKGFILIFSLIFLVGCGIFIWFVSNKNGNQNEQSNYEIGKVSSSENSTTSNTTISNNSSQTPFTSQVPSNPQSSTTEVPSNVQQPSSNPAPQPVEEQLSIFSTKVYSTDPARQNNISISCNKLNETVVKSGEIFSFCNTIGPASSKEGYQEADIFDNKGNKKKGLGGGNCQLSTTLYNAVLATSGLAVTERHEHSNYVPYIQKGKDAAVAYGSYDLKFKNNTGNDIKICAQSNPQAVTVSIIAIK